MDKSKLRVLNPHKQESTRLRDVVAQTEQRIREGGESSRPRSTMVDYVDIKAAFEIAEMIVESLEDTGCLHVVSGSLVYERVRRLVRGEERK